MKGIIADCGFTSPQEILGVIFRRVTHLPAYPALLVTDILTRLLGGFSIIKYDSRKILRKCTLPILMIHGKEDTFVPCRMTEEAYHACGAPKELLLVNGADHGVSFLIDKDRYIYEVEKFLAKTLGITPRKD